jgi:hypothetical protein
MSTVDTLALHYLASNTIADIAKHFGDGRQGGYLYFQSSTGLNMHVPVGLPDPEKYARYQMFSREKAKRLLQHRRHRLSSDSRAPNSDQYGGAALGNNGSVCSFSGMPEAVDEAYVLALLCGMDWLTHQHACEFMAHSPIPSIDVFDQIYDIVMVTVSGGRLTL